MTLWTVHDTPLGPLTLERTPRGLSALRFPGFPPSAEATEAEPGAFADVTAQLDEYFAGDRRAFELELDVGGTPFQQAVWQRLAALPYGATTTYTAIAEEIGRPGSVRAVGAAVGCTPVPIVLPCHRVLGADGGLRGYLGGLARKRALLDLERGRGALPLAA